MTQNSFDFSDIRKKFEEHDWISKPSKAKLFEIVFDAHAMRNYAAWYFSTHDVSPYAVNAEENDPKGPHHPLTDGNFADSLYNYPQSAEIDPRRDSVAIRKQHDHPLTGPEMSNAISGLADNPQVERVMNVLAQIVKDYISGVNQAYISSSLSEDAKTQLFMLMVETQENSQKNNDFQHILTLVMVSTLDSVDGQEIEGKDLQQGLKRIFRRSAFQSVGRDDGKQMECPFGRVFKYIWNIDLQHDEDGRFQVTGSKPGGFFDAVMIAIGERPEESLEASTCPFHQDAE